MHTLQLNLNNRTSLFIRAAELAKRYLVPFILITLCAVFFRIDIFQIGYRLQSYNNASASVDVSLLLILYILHGFILRSTDTNAHVKTMSHYKLSIIYFLGVMQ